MIVEIFATTDNGHRSGQNEDNFAVCKDLAAKNWVFKPNERLSLSEQGAVMLVADGMGGANAGEVASDIAQRVVQEQFNQLIELPHSENDKIEFLKRVINNAHEAIVAHQVQNLETAGMGTTLVILWATPDKGFVAWCGDSRLYIHRKNTSLRPATDDHSYVWELVKQGQLTPEEARLHRESNIITQSLGDPSSPPMPEVKAFDFYEGDRVLLCSDGLNSMLSDEHIEAILKQETDTVEVCKNLIASANDAGGRDNITVILFDVLEAPLKAASTPVPASSSFAQDLKKFFRTRNIAMGLAFLIIISIFSYIVLASSLFSAREQSSEIQGNEVTYKAQLPIIDQAVQDNLESPYTTNEGSMPAFEETIPENVRTEVQTISQSIAPANQVNNSPIKAVSKQKALKIDSLEKGNGPVNSQLPIDSTLIN